MVRFFLHEQRSLGYIPALVPLRLQSSTNNWSEGETRSEPPSPLGLSAGKALRSPARRRARPAESQTGAGEFPALLASRRHREGWKEAGRAGRCPRRSRRAPRTSAHTHTELPTPAGSPSPARAPGARGEPGRPWRHRQATWSRACPRGIPAAAERRPTRAAGERIPPRWRKGGGKERQRSSAARLGPRPGERDRSPTDLFLAAAALSLCLRFLNQLPTCVGVSPVA